LDGPTLAGPGQGGGGSHNKSQGAGIQLTGQP
jgi:hypothetical protein